MHILGLTLEQLWQRLGHELVAATLVEADRVRRWRRGHDHRRVPGAAGDLLQLGGQAAADPRATERLADVEERELRNRGPQMRHDDADPDQPSIDEGAERDPTRVDVVLEFVPLASTECSPCPSASQADALQFPGRSTSSVPCCS